MKKRILLVDDSETVRVQILQALSRIYQTSSAADGREALLKAATSPPDAMVIDLEMPVMSGLELLRALRAEPRTASVPVIVVTSSTSVDLMNACRTAGCSGIVLKPVNTDYLVVKLRSLFAAPAKC